jgi:hypothetical protein
MRCYWKDIPAREQYGHDWIQLFVELIPPETSDPDGLAIAHEGVKYIREAIDQHLRSKRFQSDRQLLELRHVLDELLAANREFAVLQQKEEADLDKYDIWRTTVIPLLDRVVQLTHGRVAGAIARAKRISPTRIRKGRQR